MNINNLFKISARPCSKVTGNRVKPSFTFVRNWETVISPQAQDVSGKEPNPSGVIISPRPHLSANSSFSSIAEYSPTPVIISHANRPPPHSLVENEDNEPEEEMVDEDQDDDDVMEDAGDFADADDHEGNDGADGDDEPEDDSDHEAGNDVEMEDEIQGHLQQNIQIEVGKDSVGNKSDVDEELVSPDQAQSDASSSDLNAQASLLMPPPPAPTATLNVNAEELPDVSPIPVTIPSSEASFKTPASAGIKRKSKIMTSTPAHYLSETPVGQIPDLEIVESAKRPKDAANTFVPARKRPAPSTNKSVSFSTQVGQAGSLTSDKSDSEQSVMSLPEVQLWVGAGPLRKVSDATELDVVLTALEEVSYEFKQKDTYPMKRKTVNEFVLKVRKEITNVIDSVQELKSAQSSLNKATHPLKVAYKDLVQKQQQYFNLMEQEANLEKERKAVEKKKAMKDVSEWLFQLEDLQTRYRESATDSPAEENYNTRENLPALLKETIVNLTAANRLKSTNDQVERLIESRLNSSRHGRHLRNVPK